MSFTPYTVTADSPTGTQRMCSEHDAALLALHEALVEFERCRFNIAYAMDSSHDLAADDPEYYVDAAHLNSCPGLQSRQDILRLCSRHQDEFNSVSVAHDFIESVIDELHAGTVTLQDPLLRDEGPPVEDCDVHGYGLCRSSAGDCDSRPV